MKEIEFDAKAASVIMREEAERARQPTSEQTVRMLAARPLQALMFSSQVRKKRFSSVTDHSEYWRQDEGQARYHTASLASSGSG